MSSPIAGRRPYTLDGKRILPGVYFRAAGNGYFLDFGRWGTRGARISLMPKNKTQARKRYFHVSWWTPRSFTHLYIASRPGARWSWVRKSPRLA